MTINSDHPKRDYICPKGHTWQSSYPFTITIEGGDFRETVECCPKCLIELLKTIPGKAKVS